MAQDTTKIMQAHERLAAQIGGHDKELAELRTDISSLQVSQKHVAEGQKLLAQKFDEFAGAFSARGKASVSEIAAYLQVVALLFAIAGSVVAGIVYVAGNANNSRLDLLQYRVDKLHGSFGWTPEVRKSATGN